MEIVVGLANRPHVNTTTMGQNVSVIWRMEDKEQNEEKKEEEEDTECTLLNFSTSVSGIVIVIPCFPRPLVVVLASKGER